MDLVLTKGGEGVQNSENLADVIYERPPMDKKEEGDRKEGTMNIHLFLLSLLLLIAMRNFLSFPKKSRKRRSTLTSCRHLCSFSQCNALDEEESLQEE